MTMRSAIKMRLIVIPSLVHVLHGSDEDAPHLVRMQRTGVGDGRPLGRLADVERPRALAGQDPLGLETPVVHADLMGDAGGVLPTHARVLRSRERTGIERRTAAFLGHNTDKQVRHGALPLWRGGEFYVPFPESAASVESPAKK